MHNVDSSRVVFHSVNDMASGLHLQNSENALRAPIKTSYDDINEVLELYNIKKYLDNDVFLRTWTPEEILDFKSKAASYGSIIGKFMSSIDDTNVQTFFNATIYSYLPSFWELFNAHNLSKRVTATVFEKILMSEPYLINLFLTHPNILSKYNVVLRDFLLANPKSAEILLSIYEIEDGFNKNKMSLPKSLTISDKEAIILNYLTLPDAHLSYIKLIENMRDKRDFKITDKTRLEARRSHSTKMQNLQENKGLNSFDYGVSITFQENAEKVKSGFNDNGITNYIYSANFIKNNVDPYSLFLNFKYLFEYLDNQNRIRLVSNDKNIGLFERVAGVTARDEYRCGISFSLSEMTSEAQITTYSNYINSLDISLEEIIRFVFEESFQEKYNFADNATFSVPTATTYLEKIRVLAPEFESALKQFKLFVEDKCIDFELLQISSAPSSIKNIPSLNANKYIYLNKLNKDLNKDIINPLHYFFSDQANLTYVNPFKDSNYKTFFDLLVNEDVRYSDYEEHQKIELDYLISQSFIDIDKDNFIVVTNPERLLILRDLHDNDVAAFYSYSLRYQQEAEKMAVEGIIIFESSLFSRPEQSYFNYYLNKSEFTNGRDLRNSYLHGTQPNHQNIREHQIAYFTYLKLIFLALLKIDDDLKIYNSVNVI